MDHVQFKQGMREMWAEGDWAAIAARMDCAARALVEECAIGPGDDVLDVAAGTGNVAVWGARAGARVVATDLSPLLVDQGRLRCAAERLAVDWREADMEDLPFDDASFDSVLSAFGISFAPRPEVALSEMFRVTRPGGCVGLANWTRGGWPASVGAIMERHFRPPSSSAPPPAEDKAGTLAAWLLEHAASVRTEHGFVWQQFESPQAWWEHWDGSAPQMAVARRMLPEERYRQLRDELIESVSAANTGDETSCRWPSPYLLLVAAKRPSANDDNRTLRHKAPAPAPA